MQKLSPRIIVYLFLIWPVFHSTISHAQSTTTEKSAREAALSDTRFISGSIEDNEDIMFLSQKAIERATDSRIKEMAQELVADRSRMLYAMEQLGASGSGSSAKDATGTGQQRAATILNSRLSSLGGTDFDTSWVSGLLNIHEERYDELSRAKETVTNPQLKTAVTEAIPTVRKYVTQLRSLKKTLAKEASQKEKLNRQKK